MNLQNEGKILVTGGAGFIGSALIWALNKRGIENIIIADYLGSDEKWKNLVPLRFDHYLEADKLLEKLERKEKPFFGEIRVVFHLGACSSTTETDASYLTQNNYEYTRMLVIWALSRGIRFVYASSDATYGGDGQGMDDKDEDLARLRPLNMYGYSKHMFDLYAQRHNLLEKIVGLKYFNVFGPNEYHKGNMRSLVHKAYEQIRDCGAVKLFKSYHPDYPDGEQKRDFLYVKDAVAMTLFLAENENASGLFNIGSGQAHTWIELVEPIFQAMDKLVNIEFIDMPEAIQSQYQYFTQADTSKLRHSGYGDSVTPLAEAVTDYVKNYLLTNRTLGA